MKGTIRVAVPIRNEETFYYSVPLHLQDGIQIGKRVLVPFKSRRTLGFTVGFGKPPDGLSLREIIDIVDEEPLFDEKRLEFLNWIARYYLTSLGIVLKAAHPGGLGISLKKTIKITERGANLPGKDRLGEIEKLILKTLSISGEILVRKLIGLVEGATYELLNSLRRRRLIEFDYELSSDPKVKIEKIIAAQMRANLEDKWRRSVSTRAQIFDYILSHGRVPYTDIRATFGDVSRHIQWLEERGFVKIEHERISRDPFSDMTYSDEIPTKLNPDQERAFHRIKEALGRGRFFSFLLHGVTGSGKTEVYLRVIGEVIKNGKEAIVLVPEISLTPQLVKRFRGRFGKEVAVIHSALSDGERFDAWRMARCGEVKVIIGARSAIFAPFKNLGIIVVDEEHESSYKQDESPRYNARDLSLVLGKMANAVVVLGSATPSVESYANALIEKFTYLSLPLRVQHRPLPEVDIVDMRGEKGVMFSERLMEAIKENHGRGGQTILFLNRRGFSTLIICPTCGHRLMCPNCTISLTYHIKEDSLRCHYCGILERFIKSCGKCGANLRTIGMGTQKIEEELKKAFPGARIARMDRDAMVGKIKLLNLYGRLEKGEVDILVGTQMVAKGHDLPGVTLVGVISADLALGIPDFRAGERTFQLITQVAGRAGRGDHPGRVIVQTYNPEHPSIKFAVKHDSVGFLNEELQLREELGYPPFSRVVNFRLGGRTESETANVAKESGEIARRLVSKLPIGVIKILGPSPSPIYKIKNQYRWQMLMLSSDLNMLHRFSRQFMNALFRVSGSGRVKVSIDIDPMGFI
jgi:primosomal protein N' (replication factor Y) (superfamily II helicase)